jgi:hypothetical protein
MCDERDVWNTALYNRAIQKRIGEALLARLDLSQRLPDRLRILLRQLDEPRADGFAVTRTASLLRGLSINTHRAAQPRSARASCGQQ